MFVEIFSNVLHEWEGDKTKTENFSLLEQIILFTRHLQMDFQMILIIKYDCKHKNIYIIWIYLDGSL